jgi:hypothetical protein
MAAIVSRVGAAWKQASYVTAGSKVWSSIRAQYINEPKTPATLSAAKKKPAPNHPEGTFAGPRSHTGGGRIPRERKPGEHRGDGGAEDGREYTRA